MRRAVGRLLPALLFVGCQGGHVSQAGGVQGGLQEGRQALQVRLCLPLAQA